MSNTASKTAVSTDGDFVEVEESSITVEANEGSSFEEQVNAATKTMVLNEETDLWELPKDHGLTEEVAFAAKLEKRRRDTQGKLARTEQELATTKTQTQKLTEKLKDTFAITLTDEQQAELDELAESDPEAYRKKMNEYEDNASAAFAEELSDLGYDEDQQTEMATRAELLATFNNDNPELTLNDEVFENDLPPRITGKLNRGEISFEEFLEEAKVFLSPKAIAGTKDDDDDEPDLSKAGGGSEASEKAQKGDLEQSYLTEVY